MTVSRTFLPLLATLAPLTLGACDLGTADIADDGGFRCVDTPTVIVSADQVTALGFAPAEILAVVEGEHETPIFWRSTYADGPIDLQIGPESGEGTLTVKLAHDGGEIRFVESVPESDNGFEPDFGECADYLEIDLTATLTSSGGALGETLPVTLRSTSPVFGQVAAELDLEALAGSFSVTSADPDVTVGPATLDVGVSPYGISGALSGMVQMEQGDAVGVGFIEYATFPSAEPRCYPGEFPVPFDEVLEGFSAADALALVNRNWIFELGWAGQEPTSMELTAVHDGGEVCVSVGSEWGAAGSLRFGADVSLSTGDGTVDASFPVTVSAEPGDEGLGQVHLWNDAPYGSLVPVEQMGQTYGKLGVDLSGYDLGGIEFGGAFAPYDDPGSADGSLTVLGGIDPQCAGGSDDDSSGGCPGVDITEVARAEWGNTGVEP